MIISRREAFPVAPHLQEKITVFVRLLCLYLRTVDCLGVRIVEDVASHDLQFTRQRPLAGYDVLSVERPLPDERRKDSEILRSTPRASSNEFIRRALLRATSFPQAVHPSQDVWQTIRDMVPPAAARCAPDGVWFLAVLGHRRHDDLMDFHVKAFRRPPCRQKHIPHWRGSNSPSPKQSLAAAVSLIQVKAAVLYWKPHALMTSNAPGNSGITHHRNNASRRPRAPAPAAP